MPCACLAPSHAVRPLARAPRALGRALGPGFPAFSQKEQNGPFFAFSWRFQKLLTALPNHRMTPGRALFLAFSWRFQKLLTARPLAPSALPGVIRHTTPGLTPSTVRPWARGFCPHGRPGPLGFGLCGRLPRHGVGGFMFNSSSSYDSRTPGRSPVHFTLHRALHDGRPGFPGAGGRLPIRPRCGRVMERVYVQFHSFRSPAHHKPVTVHFKWLRLAARPGTAP